jgi:hypothetical protein
MVKKRSLVSFTLLIVMIFFNTSHAITEAQATKYAFFWGAFTGKIFDSICKIDDKHIAFVGLIWTSIVGLEVVSKFTSYGRIKDAHCILDKLLALNQFDLKIMEQAWVLISKAERDATSDIERKEVRDAYERLNLFHSFEGRRLYDFNKITSAAACLG